MIKNNAHKASLLVLLFQLISLQLSTIIVDSLSISSSNKNSLISGSSSSSSSSRNNNNNNLQNVIQATMFSSNSVQQQQPQITTLPPLITTLSQNGYLAESLVQPKQAQDDLHPASERSSDSHRLNSEDHDDSVPLATINNHSRNQPASRPPQYVDVSALVGRDRNLTQSSTLIGGASSGASGLSAKSRSGLPECATQQVCNAIFVRMNYTQKLCACSSNYNWKCSNTLDPQDGHTIELTRKFDKRIYTQIKTCEPLREVRACKSPTDWTLLALQSERSGKAHYVVVCKCPTWAQLEGPYTHNHPPYANIPGIRVYGMLCAHQTARSSAQTYSAFNPSFGGYPDFPWPEALNVLNTTNLVSTLDSH